MISPEGRGHLLYALRRALRPIARWLIRTGIRFDEFADVARGVYVESAICDRVGQPDRPTRERIAMMTGVTRQEVDDQIEHEGSAPRVDPTQTDLAVEVLQKWHSTPEYEGPYGIPLELEFAIPAGRSFSSLVALVDPKANPRAVLAELVRSGAVVRAGERHFRAVSRSFVLSRLSSPIVIEHFGRILSRLATTLEYNMDPGHVDDGRLERHVIADRGLPSAMVPEFEEYAASRAADFLMDLDNWLSPYTTDEWDTAKRIDTGVHVFLFVETPVGDEPLASLVSTSDSPEII